MIPIDQSAPSLQFAPERELQRGGGNNESRDSTLGETETTSDEILTQVESQNDRQQRFDGIFYKLKTAWKRKTCSDRQIKRVMRTPAALCRELDRSVVTPEEKDENRAIHGKTRKLDCEPSKIVKPDR